MSVGGILVMLASVLGITSLFAWCIYKVLSTPGSEQHLHGFEGELPDKDT
ncbi:MAG: hypothetical protein PF961_08730 [Planctomycetota bacterium]|jgi:hypothetical protein|nr:hypothetical protein [Planctomycetota bacterium]